MSGGLLQGSNKLFALPLSLPLSDATGRLGASERFDAGSQV